MELGIKKPKINFNYRDNETGSSDKNLKKEVPSKTGFIMLEQARNKSIANIDKKTTEIIKSSINEKATNFDHKKYVSVNLLFRFYCI